MNMNTDYKTMIIFLPTASKSISYSEIRNITRHLIGSIYENQDAKKEIDNADPATPINCIAYDRQLSDKEKKAINDMCSENGFVVLFIEGTESALSALDSVDNATIIIE